MAIWVMRSRLAHHLGKKIASLEASKPCSWVASSLHPWIPPPLASSDDRYASKFPRNPAALYAARRFGSTKAQESVSTVTDGSNQVELLSLFLLILLGSAFAEDYFCF